MNSIDLSLYLVLVPEFCTHYPPIDVAQQAVDNGVTVVQLRMKNASTHEIVAMAEQLKPILGRVPLIINDNIAAAHTAQADGIHLGQEDASAEIARARLGQSAIIGISVNCKDHLKSLPKTADYIGLGPVYSTQTKTDPKPVLGLEKLSELAQQSPIPCVAIGGIKAATAQEVRAKNVDGIAVVTDICSSPAPGLATKRLRDALLEHHHPT